MFLCKIVISINFHYDLDDLLGLHYFSAQKFRIFQLITYMFMHANFSHIFFNMFALWMFGSAIENIWGAKRFLIYYLITGLGAALIHYTVLYFQISPDINLMEAFISNPTSENLDILITHHRFMIDELHSPELYDGFTRLKDTLLVLSSDPSNATALNDDAVFISEYLAYFKNLPTIVGASGSLFGILLAFGMMFPNTRLFLLFIPVPIKAKYFVIGYGALELYSGLQNNPGDNVAHFAHLGGMLFGYLLIRYWRRKRIP